MELLSAQGIAVTIAGKWVCRDLDLCIRPGERWAILGPNGSGKTTLLHTLAGLRPAQGGDIMLHGRHLDTWRPRERARLLGTLLQHYDDPFPSTVLETALIGRHPHLKRWQWEDNDDLARARGALAMMDLAGFENRTIATLSGGERRRLAIATLLTQNPQLLLLDEPTNHLDLLHQIHVLELLTRLTTQEARALIMVLHDITSTARYCDHALLLFGQGEALAGTVTDIINEENLARLYGHSIRRLAGPDGDVWTPAFSGN
jgi:iron complex transport system ATP-binding protein